jgi:heme/copper-type cytochrome/quinol oxidase subunit 4
MRDFLKKNIVELIALGAFIQFLIVMLFVLFSHVKSNETTTMMILTSSTNIVVIVLTYYFGSSKGSRDKQDKLDKLTDAQITTGN